MTGTRKIYFTLIEMLVVIAIVGILTSLLMPALQNAMTTARMAQCSSSQRNVGAAYMLYAEDWNGFLPPDNTQTLSEWHCFTLAAGMSTTHLLGPYAGYPDWGKWINNKRGTVEAQDQVYGSVFHCPSFDATPEELNLLKTGLGQNMFLGPESGRSATWNVSGWSAAQGIPAKLDSIKEPSKLMARCDSISYGIKSDLPVISDLETAASFKPDLTRHHKGTVMLFSDMHVKWFDGMYIFDNVQARYRIE